MHHDWQFHRNNKMFINDCEEDKRHDPKIHHEVRCVMCCLYRKPNLLHGDVELFHSFWCTYKLWHWGRIVGQLGLMEKYLLRMSGKCWAHFAMSLDGFASPLSISTKHMILVEVGASKQMWQKSDGGARLESSDLIPCGEEKTLTVILRERERERERKDYICLYGDRRRRENTWAFSGLFSNILNLIHNWRKKIVYLEIRNFYKEIHNKEKWEMR